MAAVNDIFRIISIEKSNEKIIAGIGIDPKSEIFKGHFPGRPVIPGACMLQLVKDVMEDAVKWPLQLKKAEQIKFLAMITPDDNLDSSLGISYKILGDGFIQVNAQLVAGDLVCFKFRGSFVCHPGDRRDLIR